MAKDRKQLSIRNAVAIMGFSLIGLAALGYFNPRPEHAPAAGSVFVYFGPEGETVPIAGASSDEVSAAEAALADVDYYGAFAIGPHGRTGAWTGARSRELAGSFALAVCGQDCRVVAERLPLHRDSERSEPIATEAMVQNLMMRWPFTDDYLALGGAGAWGQSPDPAGKATSGNAKRRALAECEVRRAAENTPEGVTSPPCAVRKITDIEILRPKPQLYPAAYTIELTPLTPVEETEVTSTTDAEIESGLRSGLSYKPPYLHGARAANGETSFETVRGAGWPEAGHAIALLKCNAERRPGEPPCALTHVRSPSVPTPTGTLAVTPELFASFQDWESKTGHRAFAISPYGAWGFSYDHPSRAAAIQKAADWCWYNTRRNWEYRQVDRASLSSGIPCRIVAIRSP